MRKLLVICAICGLAAATGCAPPEPEATSNGLAGPAFLGDQDPSSWVTIYDPARASNGYTLALYQRRTPMLLDMNGRIVHSWPEARVKSRVRLLADGTLLGLALGRAVVEYNWEGKLTWEVPFERALPHHDVIRLANGNTMVLILREGERFDDVVEIDRSGRTVWEWRSAEHLTGFYDPASRVGEVTHLNSVQELPANRWHDAGDERFRPGNLLVSARNLDTIFLIDRETKDVVWHYDTELDRQHEALMIAEGMPGAGNILVFDNGYASRHRYRSSQIREIDPQTKTATWSYDADGFYSPTGGIEQPLANGNVLVSSTRGGRAFEITRSGRMVWQWVPGFEPNRPSRVAFDHCPQLAAMARPVPRPVRPASDYRHIDPRTYIYARSGAIAKVRIDGTERQALIRKNGCRRVLVPPKADILLGFGINKGGATRSGRKRYSASFQATLADPKGSGTSGGENRSVLVEEALSLANPWREHTLELDAHAGQWKDLCLAIESSEPASEVEPTHFAFWTNPAILPRTDTSSLDDPPATPALTATEAEVQRKHLEALGYVD